jgi:hypothetical protein
MYAKITCCYYALLQLAGTSLQPRQQQQQQQVPPLLSRDDDGNFEVDRSAIENFLRPPAEELPEDIEVGSSRREVFFNALHYATCRTAQLWPGSASVRLTKQQQQQQQQMPATVGMHFAGPSCTVTCMPSGSV